MKFPLAVTAASLTLGITMLATPAHAEGGDQRPCVTRGEFRAVKKGDTKARVQDVFDSSGKFLFRNPGVEHNEAKTYRACDGDTVQIQYNNYGGVKGGPQRLVYKQRY